MRGLTVRNAPWEWNRRHQEAFDTLKKVIARNETLAFFSKDKATHVLVDAGPDGLGGILAQTQADGSMRPVAFASKSLTKTEAKYSQTEKEALAVV